MPLAQVKALLMIASQLSGYPIPDGPMPVVQEVSHKQIAIDGCDAADETEVVACGIIGITDEDGNIEVDAQTTTEPEARKSLNAVTVHELTHWLQIQHHKDLQYHACPERFLIEFEAYKAEVAYQIVYEHKPLPEAILIPPTVCPFK